MFLNTESKYEFLSEVTILLCSYTQLPHTLTCLAPEPFEFHLPLQGSKFCHQLPAGPHTSKKLLPLISSTENEGIGDLPRVFHF